LLVPIWIMMLLLTNTSPILVAKRFKTNCNKILLYKRRWIWQWKIIITKAIPVRTWIRQNSSRNMCSLKVNKLIMGIHKGKRITITVTVIIIERSNSRVKTWWKVMFNSSMSHLMGNQCKVLKDLLALKN
jgi:hypothetical protein